MHRVLTVAIFASGSVFAQNVEHLGMTWGSNTNASTGDNVVFVTCHGFPKSREGGCNAYRGDTGCSTALPVLCLKPDGRPRPAGLITAEAGTTAAMPKEFYAGWAGGVVALTEAVPGTLFGDQAAADAYCEKQLGAGWRMAEFHDGIVEQPLQQGRDERVAVSGVEHGGWAFYANGVTDRSSRFWVAINDQPANCWNSSEADSKLMEIVRQPITSEK